MKYKNERAECIPCANWGCGFWSEHFEFNCSGMNNCNPSPEYCRDYKPERKKRVGRFRL